MTPSLHSLNSSDPLDEAGAHDAIMQHDGLHIYNHPD